MKIFLKSFVAFCAVCALYLGYSIYRLKNPNPQALTVEENTTLETVLLRYDEPLISPLFWNRETAGIKTIDINAASGGLIDVKTGSILYEKNYLINGVCTYNECRICLWAK